MKRTKIGTDRRGFLAGALGGAFATKLAHPAPAPLVAATASSTAAAPAAAKSAADLSTWAGVRSEFLLSRDWIHMAGMLFASHPRPVREAIDRHRRGFDDNPVVYLHDNIAAQESAAVAAAAEYVGGKTDEIALTGNTTTGLALLYGGLPLKPKQEIVATTHDHYVTYESLRLRAKRSGASFRKNQLYAVPEKTTDEEIVGNFIKGLGPRTRIAAVTWVHSSTGVKLPIRKMADALADFNKKRGESDRVLLCVDGVHAFGIEHESAGDLGCDFLVAGCHKWLFGPRGTGMVWGRAEAWKGHAGIIPAFEWKALEAWMQGKSPDEVVPPAPLASPGGFHAFDHRWALAEAFKFHGKIGKPRISARIHELNTRCKQGLAAIPKVKLHTPLSPSLSAGINAFEIEGMPAKAVVEALFKRKVIASDSPYAVSYARLTPGILNTEDDVDRAVAAVKEVAG